MHKIQIVKRSQSTRQYSPAKTREKKWRVEKERREESPRRNEETQVRCINEAGCIGFSV